MFGLDKTWTLDPRLEADTIFFWSNDNWQTRLMNDRRWPWLMLVPVCNDCYDVEDLNSPLYHPLMAEISEISQTFKTMGCATSSNVATLSNIVKQMHWHVVGRNVGDLNWPAPVWGLGEREPYSPDQAKIFIEEFKAAWNKTVPPLRRF